MPLGTKDFNDVAYGVSNKDDTFQLNSWNVLSFYRSHAINYFEISGTGYIITANESDD